MLEICVILSGMEKLCWLSPRAEDFWVRWELNTGESLVWAVHSEDQGWPHAYVAEIPSESPGDTCCSLRCHLWLMESLKREIVGSCESVPGKYYCSSPYSCCSSLTCSTHGWTGFWAEQTFRLAQDNVCVSLECAGPSFHRWSRSVCWWHSTALWSLGSPCASEWGSWQCRLLILFWEKCEDVGLHNCNLAVLSWTDLRKAESWHKGGKDKDSFAHFSLFFLPKLLVLTETCKKEFVVGSC